MRTNERTKAYIAATEMLRAIQDDKQPQEYWWVVVRDTEEEKQKIFSSVDPGIVDYTNWLKI